MYFQGAGGTLFVKLLVTLPTSIEKSILVKQVPVSVCHIFLLTLCGYEFVINWQLPEPANVHFHLSVQRPIYLFYARQLLLGV